MNEVDVFKGKKYNCEINIIPEHTSRGIATISGSYGNLAWGLLEAGLAKNYYVFDLITDAKGNVTDVLINQKARIESKDGTYRNVFTQTECETVFNSMLKQFAEAKKLENLQMQKQQRITNVTNAKEARGAEIRSMRESFQSELYKLADGKSITEQLNDPDIQALASRITVLNVLYPKK